jgi:hypothetical protein
VRGTQTLVDQMGWVFSRPYLVAMEIAWRWAVGIPLLFLCWRQARAVLAAIPLDSTGLTNLDAQNPWVAAVQLANAWERYEPHVLAVLLWLLPVAALAWTLASGVGRSMLIKRLEPGLRLRPVAMIAVQLAWVFLFGLVFLGWFRSMRWAAATHISVNGEADLIGYFIWAIFLSLGFFTLWAVVNWPLAIAPTLMLLENRTPLSAIVESFRLGRTFTGKLMEINLVMGIVKLALVVLAMVFSAAPLPFSDELGPDALHFVSAGAALFYLVASDYFHVVKLKSFVEFWHTFRGNQA